MARLRSFLRMSKSKVKQTPRKTSSLSFEALESRLLLNADFSLFQGLIDIEGTTIDLGTVVQGSAPMPFETFTAMAQNVMGVTNLAVAFNPATPFSVGANLLDSPLDWNVTDDFTIEMDTTTPGVFGSTVTINGNIQYTEDTMIPLSFEVSGTVLAVQEISVDQAGTPVLDDNAPGGPSSVGFGSVNVGAAAPSLVFTINNDGEVDLDVGTINLPAGYTLVSDLTSHTIPGGGSDTFQVQLNTGAAGTFNGPITFTNTDNPFAGAGDGIDESNFLFNVSGTVLAAQEISVDQAGTPVLDDNAPGGPSSVGFGSVNAGAAAPSLVFTINNDGEVDLDVGTINLPAGYTLVSDLTSHTIPGGGSDTFQVQLNTGAAGTFSGPITFTNTDNPFAGAGDGIDESNFLFQVTGTVIQPVVTQPEIEVNMQIVGGSQAIADGQTIAIDFGDAELGGTPIVRTFQVTNTGNANLTLGTIVLPSGFSLVEGLDSVLVPGGSDTFDVQMGTGAVGPLGGEISFGNNDSNENPFNFNIQGQVVAPEIEVDLVLLGGNQEILDDQVSAIAFGSADLGGDAVVQTFLVSNIGTSALTAGAITLPDGFSLFEGLDSIIAPGETDTFQIQLDTSAVGSFSGMLDFSNNDADENPFNFPITGQIVAPEVDVELVLLGGSQNINDGQALAIDFGIASLGSTPIVRTFQVTNNGHAVLSLGSVNLPAGFSLTETLDASLAPGASDTFQVQLNTSAAGTMAGSLSFSNNDPDENPFDFPITGTITSAEIAVSFNGVTVNDGQTTAIDFDQVIPGELGNSYVFTVENSGDVPLTLGTLQIPAGFAVTEGLDATIAVGGSDTFTIQLLSGTVETADAWAGIKTGEISFSTNDVDENPFNFPISGEVFHLIESNNNVLPYQDNTGVDVYAYLFGPGTLYGYASQGVTIPEGYVLNQTESLSWLYNYAIGAAGTSVDQIVVNGDLLMAYGFNTTVQESLASKGSLGWTFFNSFGENAAVSSQTPFAYGGSVLYSLNGVDSGASFDFGGDLAYFYSANFSQGSLSANSIGSVIIANDDTDVDVTARNGNVNLMYALNGDMAGSVLASGNVNGVYAPAGALSSTVRGENIGAVYAQSLDNAVLSAMHDISSVNILDDVRDSHVLAGYDIGIDGLVGAGDTLNQGDLRFFNFGGAYANSHVAVGVRPIFSTLIPPLSGGDNSSHLGSNGAAYGSQSNIVPNNGGQFFGFYFDSAAGSNFATSLTSDVDFQIVSNVNG